MANPEVIIISNRIAGTTGTCGEGANAIPHALAKSDNANENDPLLGNPNGDITVVAFSDYQCGYCKRMIGPVMQLLKQDPNVRWVMKEFPILGPASVTAASASIAADKQGFYREFHIALMKYRGRLSDDVVFQTALKVGLDLDTKS